VQSGFDPVASDRLVTYICWVDNLLLSRMRDRLERLRKVAAMSHDPRIIELVSQTADEIETDIQDRIGRA